MNLEQFNAHRKTVETPAGTIGYCEIGEGPPAVFVHGLFVSSYVWHDVIDQCSDMRRCIAWDLPGHGASPPQPDQDLSLQGNADILMALCEALGLEDIDLVGNDTGGAIAQTFAVQHPELLRSFTLINCEARDIMPAHEPLPQLAKELADKGQLVDVVMQATDLEFAQSELGLAAGTQYHDRIDDELLQGMFAPHSSSEEGATEIQRFLQSLDEQQLIDIMPEVQKLEVPTMMVWGTGDPFFTTELAYWLKDNIPGATEVIEVEGGMLFWPVERPEDLVPHLRRHWAAVRETEPVAAE